jgi:hypothetical protein
MQRVGAVGLCFLFILSGCDTVSSEDTRRNKCIWYDVCLNDYNTKFLTLPIHKAMYVSGAGSRVCFWHWNGSSAEDVDASTYSQCLNETRGDCVKFAGDDGLEPMFREISNHGGGNSDVCY